MFVVEKIYRKKVKKCLGPVNRKVFELDSSKTVYVVKFVCKNIHFLSGWNIWWKCQQNSTYFLSAYGLQQNKLIWKRFFGNKIWDSHRRHVSQKFRQHFQH